MPAPIRGLDRPIVQWSLLVLCVSLTTLGIWSVVRIRAVGARVRTLEAAVQIAERRAEELDRQLARERAAREAFAIGLQRERAANAREKAAIVSFRLTPGLAFSGVPDQQVTIPADAVAVQVELVTARRARRTYRVGIRPITGGEELWTHARLRTRTSDAPLLVIVPPEILTPGAYELTLATVDNGGRREEAGVYIFEVVRP
jgi:hypothetical protein